MSVRGKELVVGGKVVKIVEEEVACRKGRKKNRFDTSEKDKKSKFKRKPTYLKFKF